MHVCVRRLSVEVLPVRGQDKLAAELTQLIENGSRAANDAIFAYFLAE